MNKKKLAIVRKKIDTVDVNILNLIKKRMILVRQMINIKNHKYEIVDKKREKNILKNIKRKSINKNIDPQITDKIWKSMILSFANYQRRKFKKKR